MPVRIFTDSLEAMRYRPEMYVGRPPDACRLAEAVIWHAAVGWLADTTHTIDVLLSPTGRLTVTDDGVPFSFEEHSDGRTWVRRTASSLLMNEGHARGPGDRARLEFGMFDLPPLAFAAALSSEFVVESCDGGVANRQSFTRGVASAPERMEAWTKSATRISFEPDPEIFAVRLDLPRLRAVAERVASFSPGRAIILNGERIAFDTMLVAGRRACQNPPWNEVLFEHHVKEGNIVFRCAVGLSPEGAGRVQLIYNLMSLPSRELSGAHLDALLTALVDAVQLPCGRTQAREEDLVGIVALEFPLSRIQYPEGLRLDPAESDQIRRSLVGPFSALLDRISGSRETLVARWR